MTQTRFLPLVAMAAALVAASCGGDDPTGVPVAPDPAPALFGGDGVVRCSPLAADSATAVIGPAGGTLRVGPHTLTLRSGSVSEPVAITAVVASEPVNRVRFAPAGLVFQAPASLTMSHANCGLLAGLVPKRIAYLGDDGPDGPLGGIVELIGSTDNLLARRVTGDITHFSSYAIAW